VRALSSAMPMDERKEDVHLSPPGEADCKAEALWLSAAGLSNI